MAHEVTQSEREVAAQVRSALIERISSERYDLWIPSNTTWEWNGEKLLIKFASDFSSQLAKKMLIADLGQALKSVVGYEAEVHFEASPVAPALPPVRSARAIRAAQVSRNAEGASGAASSEPVSDAQAALINHTTGNHAPTSQAPDEGRFNPTIFNSQSANDNHPTPHNHSTQSQRSESAAPRAGNDVDLWERVMLGTSNRLAWTTANMIVAEPGRLSPVFLHGPNGSGKTMLIHAIVQQLRSVKRLRRVVHMTSEQFTNDFTEGLRAGGLPMFRRKYRDVEALVLDDIQFFVGKKSTLAEVKHTIDNLIRLGKQVVVTADCSLNELNQLGNELTGRLRGGLVTPLFPLDEQMRVSLLSRQLSAAKIEMDQEIVQQLAGRICGDGRVLNGIVNRLIAVAALQPGKLTWEACWDAVHDLVQATQPVVRLGDIERAVCTMFGLEPDSLQSSSKMRTVTQPRMLAMFLARKYTPAAYKEIGHFFGRRQHSTVISAEKTVTGWLNENSNLQLGRGLTVRDAIRQVEAQLQVG